MFNILCSNTQVKLRPSKIQHFFFWGGGGGGCMASAASLPPWLCPRLSLTKHILKQNCTEHFILCKEERKTKIMKRFE